ncbi:MAG: hypothetical protein KIT84_06995 [Labilithrix sp.]|nr:hypothetical protein [Labilithrix sp.]MCW5810741.1 hypothetical protein [Labilithrix sp.]
MRILFAIALLAACEKDKPPAPAPAPAPSAAASLAVAADAGPAKLEKLEMEEIRVQPDVVTQVKLKWLAPKGTEINDEAPFRVRWNRSDGLAEAPADAKTTGSAVKQGYTMKVQPLPKTPNATLTGEIDIVVCDAVNHSVCLPVRRHLDLGFIIVKDAPSEVSLEVPLPSAK